MSYKPRSRKRTKLMTGRKLGATIAVVILGAGGWFAYQTFFVPPAPIYATVITTLGSFQIELFPGSAPRAVANFVSLAQSGFYDNLVWHRIVKGFLIQTGDPQTRSGGGNRSTWGQENVNYSLPLEIDPSLHNYEGYVAVAVRGTGQFYVNLSNSTSNLSLDGNYTVFGKVISGWNVVMSIANAPIYPTTSKYYAQPLSLIFINSVEITKTP